VVRQFVELEPDRLAPELAEGSSDRRSGRVHDPHRPLEARPRSSSRASRPSPATGRTQPTSRAPRSRGTRAVPRHPHAHLLTNPTHRCHQRPVSPGACCPLRDHNPSGGRMQTLTALWLSGTSRSPPGVERSPASFPRLGDNSHPVNALSFEAPGRARIGRRGASPAPGLAQPEGGLFPERRATAAASSPPAPAGVELPGLEEPAFEDHRPHRRPVSNAVFATSLAAS